MTDDRDYFRRAAGWSEDLRAQSARSRRTAWTVAGLAVAVAAFEAVALAMLAPLKTVQPITLLVDRQTGYVQSLDPSTPRRISADEALTNSLLAQYVTAREQFDRATVSIDYRRVALWSAGAPRQSYLAMMPATNPASPFQRYPAGTAVHARIKSVSRLREGFALVRFDTQLEATNGRIDPPQPWISVVRFRYVDAPMAFEDRLVNPLGFQVTGYRRDAEAPPPPSSVLETVEPPATSVQTSSTTTRTTVFARPIVTSQATSARHTDSSPAQSDRRRLREKRSDAPERNGFDRRDVPFNNVPMGSPLAPGFRPMDPAAGPRPQ